MRWSIGVIVLVGSAAFANAQEAPSFAKHVRPFFAKYCIECHNTKSAKGGLNLDSYQAMLEGSDSGPVLVPGVPDESILVLSIEGKGRSIMPPKTAKLRPKKDELGVIRAWVKAGGTDDSKGIKVVLPDIKPKVAAPPPVRALDYLGDGRTLLVARQQELSAYESDLKVQFPGPITALAAHPKDGRIVIATGLPGQAGSLTVQGATDIAPGSATPAHHDVILDLALSPDGRTLATASYDTQVKLWSLGGGQLQLVHTLKEHSDAVYGVAFSPDGKLLATTGADRAVKVWDAAQGKLLYTLDESTDWNYAVAFSPDGKELAAAGVDKSIRVWPATPEKKKIEHSVFAHEAPIIRLAYAPDGKTLYSLGEDRVLKAWDAAKMVERRVYERLPETPLSLAVAPDGKQIAVGRFDGIVQVFDAETGAARTFSRRPSGPRESDPLIRLVAQQKKPKKAAAKEEAKKPALPEAKKITPAEGRRGQPIPVTIEGHGLDKATDISVPGGTVKLLKRTPTKIDAEITFTPTAAAGAPVVEVKAGDQVIGKLPFTVDLFERTLEQEANDSPRQGQSIKTPASIVGSLEKAGGIDFYRFSAAAGQELGIQVLANAVGSKAEPVLQLLDDQSRLLAESNAGFLGYRFTQGGAYAIGVHDREFRGGPGMHYRLHVGPIPVVTAVFPLGLQRGATTEVQVEGVFLDNKTAKVSAAADAAIGSQVAVPVQSKLGPPLGKMSIVVGEFPETSADGSGSGTAGVVAVPGVANGYLREPGQRDTWRFHAKKGQRLIIETEAARLGAQLDSVLDVLDARGEPVPRAVLRCQAKTYVTFRDHDNVQPNIRIEAWDELAVNDYLYVSGELMRIRALPGHPDADCNFYNSAAGPRTGFLDTTPLHQPQGAPMYKVTIHPPGTKFPPNGFPVFTVNYRNDDGGPPYGRDSRVIFDPPADGVYQVRIGDTRGQGGVNYVYRLTVRPPRPSFNVRFSPTSPMVWREGAIPITVSADRIDGYDGPIAIRFDNVPPGFHVPPTSIEAGQASTAVALYAERSAQNPAKPQPLKVIATAEIDGQKQVKEATGQAPKVTDAGDIVTFTDESEITVKPGGRVKVTVHIERRGGFTGRVPLDIKGLPHGVHVLDIGLNGILITERETRRTITLQAERWVEPADHPIVVLARREGKNTEHAAKSVLLKVAR